MPLLFACLLARLLARLYTASFTLHLSELSLFLFLRSFSRCGARAGVPLRRRTSEYSYDTCLVVRPRWRWDGAGASAAVSSAAPALHPPAAVTASAPHCAALLLCAGRGECDVTCQRPVAVAVAVFESCIQPWVFPSVLYAAQRRKLVTRRLCCCCIRACPACHCNFCTRQWGFPVRLSAMWGCSGAAVWVRCLPRGC